MMFPTLDPLLHSELRLAVMSLLMSSEEAEFPYIKEQTGATAGNLSVQIDKMCRITPVGLKAFEEYVTALKSYISQG